MIGSKLERVQTVPPGPAGSSSSNKLVVTLPLVQLQKVELRRLNRTVTPVSWFHDSLLLSTTTWQPNFLNLILPDAGLRIDMLSF